MLSSEIRSLFIRYFKEREHTEVPSSPLVPQGDPSLICTNAGMVQFKSTFLGEEKRPYVRAVSSQKCMRAGGKHNDLDQVGKTARHHTFFEMLGNFSFGDYFKKEAISFAWELVTDVFHLQKERLWITVYQDDDEAESLWKRYMPKERILRLGAKDNFWQMGETGPCGPCSEIFIDQGETLHANCPGIGFCDCDRYIEIWNLVFMQYNKSLAGTTSLPNPSIDTGMGLERMTAVCQGVTSNYKTDLFAPIFGAIAQSIGRSIDETIDMMPARVVADHLRAMTFLISDGVIPSNEGPGYVLRRITRRAARFCKKLGLSSIHTLTGTVIDTMNVPYPALSDNVNQISQMVRMEEEQFEETLIRGGAFLEEIIETVSKKGSQTIAGEDVFKLYDTYGFPVDLTLEVAEEAGLTIDSAGFESAMKIQQERARRSRFQTAAMPVSNNPSQALLMEAAPTSFTGYAHLEEEVTVLHIFKEGDSIQSACVGEQVDIVFNPSPFYGEGGGQVGDQGNLASNTSQITIEDTQKRKEIFFHRARVVDGVVSVGSVYHAQVDKVARQNTARNHTATHLLHAVLRETLGDHVKQAGSLVCPDKLRFDFQHFAALTQEQVDAVEARVNEHILTNSAVGTEVMAVADAMSSGAMALFGEKYGASVRVVQILDVSRELCGGTHCHNTGEIGLFKIVREGSVASGVRRIEAVTGVFAYQEIKKMEACLREGPILLKNALKEKDREIEKLKSKQAIDAFNPLLEPVHVGSVPLLVNKMPPSSVKEMRVHADRLRDRLRSGIVIVGAVDPSGEKATLVIMVTPEWTALYPASLIASKMADLIGGTGGGKSDMAQAGGKSVDQLDSALEKSGDIIKAMQQ
jgi:alanyl-tRNA synthetase